MAFVAAMNTPLTKAGANGSDVYTEAGVGDKRVALYQMLVRNLAADYIDKQLAEAFATVTDPAVLKDYAVMAFQTRDVRGGKGERDVFYHMLLSLIKNKPEALKPLLALIPEYGGWMDCWKVWELAEGHPHKETIRTAITDLVKATYGADLLKVETGAPNVSLLGKWLPREGSKHHAVALELANALHPEPAEQDDRWRAYRKGCSKLNAHLKTTEIAMCEGKWASIAPGSVPGRLLAKNRKAFLNEIVQRRGRPRKPAMGGVLRHPDSADRMECREHFLELTKKALSGEVTMKGADTVYPHELATKYLHGARTTADEDAMIEAQWKAIREATAAAGGLGRVVAMSDFSGSMSGTPMEVSMALGVLISEITHPAFRDYLLGFDSRPSWISFVGKSSLKEKVTHAQHYAQGTSTNFQAACDLILKRLVEHKVPAEEAPTDLIVLTDMGFDAACGSPSYGAVKKQVPGWETHIQMIRGSFSAAGYVAPRIVLWNLRAAYKDFHAKSDEEGVVVLSGWSPSQLRSLTAAGVQVKTPYEGLREILDAPRYDKVREAWSSL